MSLHIPSFLSSNFKVVRETGEEYDMRSHGILVKKFYPQSPSPVHSRETIEGRSGFIDMGTVLDGRALHAECEFRAVDLPDFTLLQDELFQVFDSREYFYLICEAEPGKRWHVKYDSQFNIEQKAREGIFAIDFASDSPFAESVGRTDTDPINMDSDVWQLFGSGIYGDQDPIYKWAENNFQIYNGGSQLIDPRFNELLITYKGASDSLIIKNHTTGDQFQYNQPTIQTDFLELNGPRVLLNGVSSLKNSNKQLVSLAPGWNDIEVSGTASAFIVTFGFRWLYL